MDKSLIFVFVVMPFSDKFKNVYDLSIKEACKETGVFCERLDEQMFQESMLNQIYTQIYKSDFIIADMSERNPNVFYEVGYAHAKGKNVILITNDDKDIPFDLKHHQHIIYNKDNLKSLKEELIKRIKYFMDKEITKNTNFTQYIISINGEKICENMKIEIEPNFDDEETLSFNIDFHNPTSEDINPENATINLVLPIEWINRENNTNPLIDKGHVLMEMGNIPYLLPNAYSSIQVFLDKNKDFDYYTNYTEIIINYTSKYGKYDKKIFTKFNPKNKRTNPIEV
jgi:hypothetical protein